MVPPGDGVHPAGEEAVHRFRVHPRLAQGGVGEVGVLPVDHHEVHPELPPEPGKVPLQVADGHLPHQVAEEENPHLSSRWVGRKQSGRERDIKG